MYVARTRLKDDKTQSIKEHSEETARMASDYAIQPFKDLAYNCGLLHDCGKYQPSFVEKINNNPNLKVAHALCGAIELQNLFKNNSVLKMMQYCIAGHHAGMQDIGNKGDEDQATLYATLKRETEDYSDYKAELTLKEMNQKEILDFIKYGCKSNDELAEKYAFLTRYIFSCLTDADSLNSEYFETEKSRETISSNFEKCLELINQKLDSFENETELQKARGALQQQVFDKINEKADVYLMNMPTGSGKTLCSLKFALEKAIKTKKRIVYVIPYNSIIDQMSNTVEDMFGKEISILRHQSTFNFEKVEDEEEKIAYKKATENWDADFIITTAVQFFESIYGNKRGKLRKLHNLANSIIIFDEAHLMPLEYLKPCLNAIAHITTNLNSEAVFLTATMPNYKSLFDSYLNIKILDLVTDKSDFGKFETCRYKHIEPEDIDQLILHFINKKSKLIVCNTKKTAREVFEKCTGEKYHLSTYMTVLDREKTIDIIKKRLNDKADITVVSTSLIEAGVDLDFENVYREITGLDSILQAGGRCNREGKFDIADVYIFSLPTSNLKDVKVSITENIIRKQENILHSVDYFYSNLFEFHKEETEKNLLKLDGLKYFQIPFRTYSQKFKIISDNSISVVVPTDEFSLKIVNQMKITNIPQPRKLQKYLCNIKVSEIEELKGAVVEYAGMFCLTNLDYYSCQTGLSSQGKDCFI